MRYTLHFLYVFLSLTSIAFINAQEHSIPSDWNDRIQQGNLLFYPRKPPNELMASIANGYVGTVVLNDTMYVSGVFNGYSSVTPSHRARIPATSAIGIVSNSSTEIGWALDLEEAVFYHRLNITDKSGHNCTLEQRWYAHRELTHLLVHELSVASPDGPCNFQLTNTSGALSTDITFYPNGTGQNYVSFYGTINEPEEPYETPTGIAIVATTIPSSMSVPETNLTTFYFVTAITTTLDTIDPLESALVLWTTYSAEGKELLPLHKAAWRKISEAGVSIRGDLNLAQAINSSLYYLISSVNAEWPYSLSPGGLASNGYNGHTFWDCETWMYPNILLIHPDIAKGLIDYRFNRLAGAHLKALSYDPPYAGSMFPWESAFTGEEVCPSGYGTCIYEIHISGDISFALRQYWYTTKDKDWLISDGYPIIVAVATFWESRVTPYTNSTTNGTQYAINNVIPPDEFAANVNNSVYTNYVAKISFEFAIEVSKEMGVDYPSSWSEIADGLVLPFNEELDIHLEYDGYDGTIIKQADVVLLGYPLMMNMSSKVRENDLNYYAPRTTPQGPAMTWAMYAIGYIELNIMDVAASYFFRGYSNIKPPFNVWTETPGGGTVNFITGVGGFLQSVFFGYGGIRLSDQNIKFLPNLPPNTDGVTLRRLNYLGNIYSVDFDNTTVTFSLDQVDVNAVSLEVEQTISGKTTSKPLELNKPISFKSSTAVYLQAKSK